MQERKFKIKLPILYYCLLVQITPNEKLFALKAGLTAVVHIQQDITECLLSNSVMFIVK
jgi:hypothetical protein